MESNALSPTIGWLSLWISIIETMRRTPLKRSAKPMKRSRLKPVSKRKRESDKVYAKNRQEAIDRVDGLCQGPLWLRCTCRATTTHHMLHRSQGGTHAVENLLPCCAACHDWLERNPKEAVRMGFTIQRKGK